MIFSLDFGVHTPKYGTQLRRKIPRTSTSNGTKLTIQLFKSEGGRRELGGEQNVLPEVIRTCLPAV